MKQKIAILIHGFNVTKPELTVGKLRPFLEYHGYKVVMFRYGHTNLLQVRLRNKSIAKKLAKLVGQYKEQGHQVEVFCHSNGAAITYIATSEHWANIDLIAAINPALKRDLNPGKNAAVVHVYHNDDDTPVKLAKWLRWLTPLARSARPWGEMGRVGYQGNDTNVLNFDTKNDFQESARGHSGVFKEPEINCFGQMIAELADRRIGEFL